MAAASSLFARSLFAALAPTLALGASLSFAVPAIAQQAEFKAADQNGDGALDKTEFKTFIDQLAVEGKPNAVKIKSSGRYDMAFGRLDKNGDGRITPDELSSMK